MARPLMVMLVDDNPADHGLLDEALAELAVEADLVAYRDATSFVQHLRAYVELPDLVILDIGMPGLDGYTVLAQVVSAWPGVPVVVVSGAAFPDREQRALSGGALAFFGKPWRFADYLAVIREVLGFARAR